MRARPWRSALLLVLVGALGVLAGCMTREVKTASEALEQARSAGKDKECPADFQEAEALVRRAEELCQSCKREEANGLANQAMSRIAGLCPAKPTPAPAPAPEPVRTPPPPAAGPPTASLTANPGSLNAGACSELTWSATNSSSVMIDPEVGSVGPSGSRRVCPSNTTRYTLTVNGPGGTRSADTTVTVKPKPTETLTIHVNFDTNKYAIKKSDMAELDKLEAFVRKYQSCKFEVNGYTDSTGSEAFNQGLSERRADAVRAYIISKGGNPDRVTSAGHGEADPVADNATVKGRAENRRAEVEAYCQ